MSTSASLLRKAHFLGAKIRSLRKRQNLTLEDLSIRCSRRDPEAAPSVSYLSMIETGKTAAELVADPVQLGQLVRTDLEGKGQVIWSEEAYVSDVEMTHDVRWLVSSTTRVKRAGGATNFEFGVLVIALGGGKAQFFALGDAGRALLGRGAVALSP